MSGCLEQLEQKRSLKLLQRNDRGNWRRSQRSATEKKWSAVLFRNAAQASFFSFSIFSFPAISSAFCSTVHFVLSLSNASFFVQGKRNFVRKKRVAPRKKIIPPAVDAPEPEKIKEALDKIKAEHTSSKMDPNIIGNKVKRQRVVWVSMFSSKYHPFCLLFFWLFFLCVLNARYLHIELLCPHF